MIDQTAPSQPAKHEPVLIPVARTPPSEGTAGEVNPSRIEVRFEQMLSAARLLVLIPVVGLVALALGAFAYGAFYLMNSVAAVTEHPHQVAENIARFLSVIDLFLIGATMLIAAFGLYELFISRIDSSRAKPLPRWLLMRDLNDLKARVIGMIVLVASVIFIEVLVDFRSSREVLELGIGVAVVVSSLTVFLRFGGQRHGED